MVLEKKVSEVEVSSWQPRPRMTGEATEELV